MITSENKNNEMSSSFNKEKLQNLINKKRQRNPFFGSDTNPGCSAGPLPKNIRNIIKYGI